MATVRTDSEIAALITEQKLLPANWEARLQPQPKDRMLRSDLEVMGENGNDFRVMVRQSSHNPLDFSVILAFCPKGSSEVFILRRYNGKSHEHLNPIEGERLARVFHVHEATERYQSFGERAECFAREADRYQDQEGALNCLINECGFKRPPTRPTYSTPLFPETGGGE